MLLKHFSINSYKSIFYLNLSVVFFLTIDITSYTFAQNDHNFLNLIKKSTIDLQLNIINTIPPISRMENTNENIINVIAIQNSPLISTSIPLTNIRSHHIIDATDCLKNIPGFSIIRNSGSNNDFVFRGMSKSKIRVLINNSEIIGACPSHMDPSSAYIASETFDILNIIKGPQTVLWGPVTSGGILQFQRYHPNFHKPKIKLRSNITAGSNDSISKNVDSILGNQNGYIRLIGNTAHAKDYKDGNNCRVHSAWYKWNIDTIISYNFNKNIHVEINLGQGNGCANYAAKSMDGLCFARESYELKTEILDINDLINKIELQTWIHQIHHLMVYTNSIKTIQSPTKLVEEKHCCSHHNINNVDRLLWGTRIITNYQLNNILFYSGIDIHTNQYRKNKKYQYIHTDSIIKDIGIFTEIIRNLLLNQKIIGGFRLGYNTIYIYNNNADIYCNRIHIYPTGFMRYEANTHQSFLYYIGVGTSQRFPDYWELMSRSNTLKKCMLTSNLVNPLKPETTVQIDCGIHFKNLKIDGWMSSYVGYIKNFICYDANEYTENNFLCYVNNQAKICGSEIGLNYKFNDYWYGKSNVSWVWGINLDNKHQLPTIPPSEGTFICQFKRNNYTLESSWRLVSSSTWMNKIFPFLYSNIFSPTKDIKTPGFSIFSIYATYEIPIYHTLCSIGINNVFNRLYSEFLNTFDYNTNIKQKKTIYEPGRTWWVKVEIKLL